MCDTCHRYAVAKGGADFVFAHPHRIQTTISNIPVVESDKYIARSQEPFLKEVENSADPTAVQRIYKKQLLRHSRLVGIPHWYNISQGNQPQWVSHRYPGLGETRRFIQPEAWQLGVVHHPAGILRHASHAGRTRRTEPAINVARGKPQRPERVSILYTKCRAIRSSSRRTQ